MTAGKKKIIRIASLVLTVIWMGVIFYYSDQDKIQSSATSMSVSYRLVAATGRILGQGWSQLKILILAGYIEKIVRKLAHMTEYAILAVLAGMVLDMPGNLGKPFRAQCISEIICGIYAATDEIHQLYVYGRHGCVKDVCIDCAGAAIGLIVVTLILRRLKKGRFANHLFTGDHVDI